MNHKILFFSLILTSSLFANQEIGLYSLKKYNKEFNQLNDTQKANISKEYEQLKVINQTIKKDIENNALYKVLDNMNTFDIWSNYFMQNYTPNEQQIKSLYNKTKPQTLEKYKLRDIIVKYESSADKIIDKLNSIKNKKDRLSRFIELVKQYSSDFNTINKDGDMGWINANLLHPHIKIKLKDKLPYDYVKVNLNNNGWQILFIEEYKPKRDATYKESKNSLIIALKKEALRDELKRILGK